MTACFVFKTWCIIADWLPGQATKQIVFMPIVKNTGPNDIDSYISSFPEPVRNKLKELRAAIRKAAPEAEEKISYRMPTFVQKGNLVHFAAFTRHIGFYPTPSGVENFKDELAGFRYAKGSIQFPVDRPLPYYLVTRIVTFRVKENLARAESKRKKQTKNL